ncbi:K02A2.6-like [Cordylochernes scorpioides]|uniref:RNA-directed DNA polymerase n=1 Tax=Cordylochernes scorpioides TaxID=51811 RepID=A0ABY6K0A9_9ARAC|nr:K02A2.6-like [Cordylochernes scorpioides]
MATTNLNYPRFREGEDLNCYLEQLEECFKLNKTLEADKVSVLLTSIDVNVYKTLRDLLVPRRPSDLKYKDLVEVLTNHLYPIKNKHYERYLFHKIVQKENEPVGKFVLRLKSQADKCKFTDINENLCDQFVSGCFDEATLKRLLSEPFLTFDSAINIANSVEAAKSQVKLMKNPGHDIDKLKARSKNFKFPCKYNNPCKICGKSNHDTKLCKFKNAQCYICNKKGHIAPVCWNKKSAQNSGMNTPNQNKLNTIQCNTLENAPKIMVNVKIEDADTIMEVDTGADVSVVSKNFFLTNLKNVTLEKYSGHLKSFSGNLIPVFGKCLVNVSYKNYQEKLPLIVTGQFNNQTPLLGRNWIRILKADWPNCVFDICNNINVISNLELFLEVYKRVFENKDLPIQGIKGSISLRPNAKPKFFKFRPVPFSIKEKIDKELDRLEKSQIIEKVNASDWSTPLVTVIKSNGELRLCGDFKNTLNNCIEDEKYPLPTIETMLGNLGGNKNFTKLDLSSAYHQIEMDEASKNLLVVSTHRGLYRYNRLPFGISPASAIFQRCMDSLFHDVPNTVIYLDDIFIGSKDEQEHYRILKMIFDKLKELNFTLNKEKCLFLKKDICFLGHIINEDGVRPDSKKLEALERCKKPFDKTSLKSFLGMLSFYSKYIPNMSTLAGPLYQLLKKDNRWKWSNQCEKAFLNLKLTLLNSQALIHYSMKLPLTSTCDASAYGISGVLCHIVEGEEKPITFVSRTLSSAEVKYSQTEKEALAIVFATSKLRQYLFGRKFVLKSDHKALTTVFGNKILLPPLIANRLHRWALELSNFDFDIRYTNNDTMLCADAFSRLPLEEINSREDNIDLVTHDISFLNVTPLDHLIIEEETNKDPVLNKLKEYLLEDPQLAKKDETMKPFLSKLENFSVLQGCIFVDSRAVIPRTCQDQMLKLLHQCHIGINRMKSLARSSVWWPKMDSQIEEFVKECSPCMHHQTAPPAENTPWPRTNQPWQRVHVDHFYFRGDCYLLVVDANSNWIEVFPARGTTSQENIKLLRECFARYGLPQCLVSDNGPPFNSIEFKEFLRKNNVYHLTSPAYNPSSNGIAEVSVRIIKKSLEKSLEESPNSNMDCILQNVLFNYRNTPTSLDKPPVERLLSYVPRTFVNCLNSEFIQKTFGSNECGRRHFQVGDKVLFTRVIQNRRKWFKAQVIRRLGYNVYLVKNLKGTFKVHVNQMRTGSDTKYAEDSDWTLDNAGAGPHRLEQDPQISTSPPPRRSTRPRCPPCRKMEQGREENPKEPMESDPDYESGENPTFPKKENTLGRTQEIVPSQEDVTPPPPVSDVLGSLARTIYQLSSATGLSRDVELPRYDGSYEAQSFFDNYDAQADLAQLHYTDRLRRLPNLLQESLTDGLPVADQRIVAAVQPNTLQAWYSVVSRVRGTHSASQVCQQTTRTTPNPSFAPSPRYCGAMHWHAQCPKRPAQSRPRPVYRATTYPQHDRTVLSSPAPFQVNNTRAHVTRSPDPLYITSPAQAVNPSCPIGTSTTAPKQACSDAQDSTTIEHMLEHGIITTSVSPYASPITLVTKRDKSKRFCVDYRRINEIIAPDVHPLPLIENILDKLSRAKYFSSADISSAYWQVEIDPSSRHLLAFVTLDGQYEFSRLPFGMRNSPQIFERAINQIFQKYKLNFIAHYFDDFIIFSDTLEEHIQHVEKFLEICQQENIKLNYKKCEFLKTSIEFLGYTIKNGTYTPQTRNLDIINAIKPPFNQKTLQSFLGAVNVYNKFIPDYARLRTPLNNLLKKDTKWQWDDKCQQAFTALKESLTRKPVLHLYQDGLPCRLYCDASTQGIAGILKQVHPDGKVHPTQYYSRALRPHERNYTISELECLAIVESIEKFRIYLSGTKFTVYSDHQALQWLKTIKNPSGRLFRWSLRLSTYDYEIQYLKGTQQHEADLLSRNPFCGFISARTIKKHQPNITDTSVAVDVNGLHTIRRKGVNRIIIPKALQHSLMNQVHSEYNHPGISQMARLISTQYYWKGMAKSIQKFVNSCHTCQIIKRPKGKPYGTLGQIPPPQQPFDLISIDTIAGFSKYGHSKTYLHVIVDHLTRYAWAFPSKSTSTLTYIQTLKKVLQQGSPKRLLSDRAPAFTSEKFRKFLLSRGIQPLLTTSNNPQANGLIERLNATITGKLRLLYLENPKTSWTKLIKQVVQIYNQSPHTVTGFPPIFLMFNSIPPELKTHYNPFPDVQKARQLASSRTQLKHERDKQKYDKGHQAPHFEIGDLVLVKNYKHPDTGKLAPYFTGPFTIIEIISPNVVRINRPNRPLNKEDDTVHVNKLKYYTEDILFLAPQPLIPTPRIEGMETNRRKLRLKLIRLRTEVEVFDLNTIPPNTPDPNISSALIPNTHDFTTFSQGEEIGHVRLTSGLHRRVKAKTSFQDDEVPIDDIMTKPLFTPQEKGRKHSKDKFPRRRWNP